MISQYTSPEESYSFDPGDIVWVKQRRIGKLQPKAVGPCTFVKYIGSQSKSAIVNTGKKEIVVSCTHLCPYY